MENQMQNRNAKDLPHGAEQVSEAQETLSLEASFQKLDTMLNRLESIDIPIEEAFTLYQQGIELLRQCSEKLDTVEKKILIMNGDGGFDEF